MSGSAGAGGSLNAPPRARRRPSSVACVIPSCAPPTIPIRVSVGSGATMSPSGDENTPGDATVGGAIVSDNDGDGTGAGGGGADAGGIATSPIGVVIASGGVTTGSGAEGASGGGTAVNASGASCVGMFDGAVITGAAGGGTGGGDTRARSAGWKPLGSNVAVRDGAASSNPLGSNAVDVRDVSAGWKPAGLNVPSGISRYRTAWRSAVGRSAPDWRTSWTVRCRWIAAPAVIAD